MDNAMKTILIVDDELETLRLYREILMDMGHRVITEADGGSALLSVHNSTKVDLVITDYKMPGMNGLEFVTALKRKMPALPVIMLTAHVSIDAYLQSRIAGVYEYVNKPVRKDEFERIVNMALDRVGPDQRSPEERNVDHSHH